MKRATRDREARIYSIIYIYIIDFSISRVADSHDDHPRGSSGEYKLAFSTTLGHDFFRVFVDRDAEELGDGCDRVPFEKKEGGITNEIQLLIYLEFVGVERIGGGSFRRKRFLFLVKQYDYVASESSEECVDRVEREFRAM